MRKQGFNNANDGYYGPYLPGAAPQEQKGTTPAAPATNSTTGGKSGGGFFQSAAFGAILNTGLSVAQAKLTAPKSVVKEACGNRPLFAGARRDTYDACAEKYSGGSAPSYSGPADSGSGSGLSMGAIIGISGAVVVVATGLYLVFRKKATA